MLLRDLKKVANESLFNPNKPTTDRKILLDVGNPYYWNTKAMEKIMESRSMLEGSVQYQNCIREAITLLILSRAFLNDQVEKSKKTRKSVARKNNGTSKET